MWLLLCCPVIFAPGGSEEERRKDAAAQVFSDVDSAYFTLISSLNLLKPYQGADGYLATDTLVRDKPPACPWPSPL